LTIVPIRRVARDARVQRSVDRNLFRSPRGARYSQERSTSSNRFNLCENCYISVIAWGAPFPKCSTLSMRVNLYENCYKLFTPGATHASGSEDFRLRRVYEGKMPSLPGEM